MGEGTALLYCFFFFSSFKFFPNKSSNCTVLMDSKQIDYWFCYSEEILMLFKPVTGFWIWSQPHFISNATYVI